MFETVQLLSLGLAAGIDSLLLLALLEPRNRRFAPVPLLMVVLGSWLWHAGLVAVLLIAMIGAGVDVPLQVTRTVAFAGAFFTPCAMVHCLARLWHSGLTLLPTPNRWFLICYLPMFALAAVVGIQPSTDAVPLDVFQFNVPFLLWSSSVNVAAVVAFSSFARRVDFLPARPLFAILGLLAFLRFLLQVGSYVLPWGGGYGLLLVHLCPIASMVCLGYFVLRHNFFNLFIDRGSLYAGFVAALLVLHQALFVLFTAELSTDFRVLCVLLESGFLIALVLAVPTWRRRVKEAVKYLLGSNASTIRSGLRNLAADLSARSDAEPVETFDWFVDRLRTALDVDFAAGWLLDDRGVVRARHGSAERLTSEEVRQLRDGLNAAGLDAGAPHDAPDREAFLLQKASASLVALKSRRNLTGLLLLGRHARNRELSAEEAATVLLLVEQLVIALDRSLLQAERLHAERRAAHGEKLAALGLLAGSVAHEVKNPLSAIKTIATVLAEDLGPSHAHAEDLRLILGEVDRLAQTTTQLLDFARPRADDSRLGCAVAALQSTLGILRHLARQRDVVLEASIPADLPSVRADEGGLREIFFNLLSNALEASGPGGRVTVACVAVDGQLVTQVRDTGPGLPVAVRERLFEPFLTTKKTGTGLGLHVVGRRVQELGGSIACASGQESGTVFTVSLPIAG